MDQRSAIKLLDETFNNDFDLGKFLIFIKNLFNHFNVKEYSSIVWKEYHDYIESYKSFGVYKDSSKKEIDILVVKLKKASSRDRARTMQRNFIAKYLGNAEKDSALVAFYGDDPQDWRFSFVKMEYNLVKDESGKVKPQKELTPAKRYSFLVGVNEPNHTCRGQFLNLIMEEDVSPSLEEIEKSFSIEKVTKIFFEEYKKLYLDLKESLERVLENDKKVKKEFEERNISTVDFAKKLLGQIVFIYFLQKKGWLGVVKNDNGGFEKWGTGPKNFLRRLFNKEIVNYDNFFNDILERLFYEALATERDDDYYRLFKCKIPFLNGGLFEPINDYDWAGTEIVLDNFIFETIFSVFDRFNFTVKEDEPLEKEVAVDPEMLGKVFENLLDVTDRKSKGAFYTPREIVHYMCQQSLINYLETNTSILREDIEKFIQLGDFATSNDERVLEDIRSKQDKLNKGMINASIFDREVKELIDKLSLPKSIIENKEKIDDLLKEIKIVDPAVGSGAFPVGMLNEIVKARSTLSIFLNKQRTDYDLKREIIENCLYGVDIESSAVDITKLRFWLSLIVDELDMKNIKPLPNLDHKIMCGNSLLEEFEGKKLFDEKLLGEVKRDFAKELKEIGQKIRDLYSSYKGDDFEKELKKLERERKKIETEAQKDRESSQATLSDSISKRIKESQVKLRELKSLQRKFFNEQNRKLKKQYRDQIDKLEWDLIKETLKEEDNEEAIEKLSEYKKNKSKPFFLWKLYFAEVFQRENPGFDVVIGNPPYGAEIDKEDLNVIKKKLTDTNNSNSAALFIDYAKNQWTRSNGTLSYIVPKSLLYSERWFSLVESMIWNVSVLVDVEKAFEKVKLEQVVFVFNKVIKTDSYLARKFLDDNFQYSTCIKNETALKLKAWICGVKEDEISLVEGLEIKLTQLNQISLTRRGIGVQKHLSDKGEFKVLGGKNIFRYGVSGNKGFITKEVMERNSKKLGFLKQKKIISQDLIAHIQNPFPHIKIMSFLDIKGEYIGLDTIQNTVINDLGYDYKYVLSLLNSKFVSWYTYKFIYCSAIRTMHFDNYYIGKIIIPAIDITQQEPFIQLVDQILSITKDDDYLDNPDKKAKVKRLEKEIGQLVYKLYDLTPEEIKIVEEFNGK